MRGGWYGVRSTSSVNGPIVDKSHAQVPQQHGAGAGLPIDRLAATSLDLDELLRRSAWLGLRVIEHH